MRKCFLALFIVFITATASASGYGNYDAKRLLTVSETPSGKKYGFDIAYLDRMLSDLSAHAKNYPVQFDTPQDRQRAIGDVTAFSGMLDLLINVPSPQPELLVRAGELHGIGHNLGIAGSAEKANARFQKLLAIKPSDPRGNYMYGTFLAGTGKPALALPYLKQALAAGVTDAAYTIGMTYMFLGDKIQALKNLEDYQRRRPGDTNVVKLIDAIRNGKVEFKQNPR
jgi:tetratricopeptide (TPR) repeat protein